MSYLGPPAGRSAPPKATVSCPLAAPFGYMGRAPRGAPHHGATPRLASRQETPVRWVIIIETWYYCGLRPQPIDHQTLSPEVRLPQNSRRFGQGHGMFGSRPPGPSPDPESDPDIFHAPPGRCALPGSVRSAALVASMQLLLLIERIARLASAREPERAAPENAESDAAQQSTSRGGAL